MTEKDSQSLPPKPATESNAATSVVQRGVEWFWRARALAEARVSFVPATEHAQLLAQRARVSADLASVVHTSEPLKPAHEAIASELYRQSSYWAARALSEYSLNAAEAGATPDWASLDETLFASPAQGLEGDRALRELASNKSFTHFADLSPDDQRRARLSLQGLSQALLNEFDRRGGALRRLHAQRRKRLAGLVCAVLVLTLGASWARSAQLEHTELAAGKSWRISSNYGGGCSSPEQLCEANTGYFFHTSMSDESSWIEFDLGSLQRVSRVRVENREDCCQDRAVPLMLEVSIDQQKFREVALRNTEFTTWQPSFATLEARWVRLRMSKPGALHLHRVRIYP